MSSSTISKGAGVNAVHVETSPPTLDEMPQVRQDGGKTAWQLSVNRFRDTMIAAREEPRVFLWCLYVLMFLVNFGFDAKMTGLIVAFPEFRKDYGYWYEPSKSYVVSALWQALWTAGNSIGVVTGAFSSGWAIERYGRKPALLFAILFSILTTIMLIVAPNLQVLFATKVLFGVATGISLTVPATYIAENAPTSMRGAILSMINMFIVFGQFLAAAVANSTQNVAGVWSYRASFLMTAFFPVVCLLGIWWLPESPAWLIAKNRLEHARVALRGLHGPSKEHTFDGIIAETMHNLHRETSEEPSFRECLKKGHVLNRTLVAVVILSMQPLSGMPFVLPYQTYFYQLSGLTRSFSIALGSTAAMLVACMFAVFFSEVIGRRRVIVWVVGVMLIWSSVIGFVSIGATTGSPATYASVAFVVSWPIFYQISLGCVGWAIASEIQTQRLRARTLSLANGTANSISWVISFTIPYLFNPDQANLGGKIMLIYLGLLIPGYIFCLFRLPETQGRSFTELDQLYDMNIDPRKFSSISTEELIRQSEKPDSA